jgi:hypothetical protein
MNKTYFQVKARIRVTKGCDTVVTFWANRKQVAGDRITFTRCDEDGWNDAAAIDAGNGGHLSIYILNPADIIWEKPAWFNRHYGCLQVLADGDIS